MDSLIHDSDLLDFKPKKGRFTWTNNKVGEACISTRLDRFLVQSNFMDGNSLIYSNFLPKLTSDHHSISLLMEEEENLGPVSF